MAQKSELIAQLAQARREVTANVRGLGRDLNVELRVEQAFRRHQLVWMGGASGFGFLLSRLFAPKRKVVVVPRLGRKPGAEEKVVKAGILVTVLKIVFDLARPALTKWVTRRVTSYAEQRFAGAK